MNLVAFVFLINFITRSRLNHGGNYSCIATNKVGSESKTIIIIIIIIIITIYERALEVGKEEYL